MVAYWKPYIMHCETKLDRTDAVPSWCFTQFPDIFGYIQRVYWYIPSLLTCYRDNRLFGFLYRSPDHILVATPMILFFLYITVRFLRSSQRLNLLTFGIFSLKEKDTQDLSLYENPVLVPFAWNFILNMLLVIFFANIDVRLLIS
jgi:hypothetical protein